MSAMISAETSEGVILLTDGAIYNGDNILTDIRRKVIVFERVPVAIAVRGNMQYGDLIAIEIIAEIETAGFDEAMRRLAERMPQYAPLPSLNDAIEVTIAGVSEQHGPRHMSFQNTGPDALSLRRRGGLLIGGTFTDVTLERLGMRTLSSDESAVTYFREHGAGIMQRFREHPTKAQFQDYEGTAFLVGGQVDMTIVNVAGVTVETIHRWPDKIGAKINPHAGKPQVTALYPVLNRQQRRQAEREARKQHTAA
jgi:hypothetical protein